jgi:hypothetical protein
MAALRAGSVEEMAVAHEDDGSCCRREAWPDTLRQLLLADVKTLIVEAAP